METAQSIHYHILEHFVHSKGFKSKDIVTRIITEFEQSIIHTQKNMSKGFNTEGLLEASYVQMGVAPFRKIEQQYQNEIEKLIYVSLIKNFKKLLLSYQALFVIGICLLFVSLLMNYNDLIYKSLQLQPNYFIFIVFAFFSLVDYLMHRNKPYFQATSASFDSEAFWFKKLKFIPQYSLSVCCFIVPFSFSNSTELSTLSIAAVAILLFIHLLFLISREITRKELYYYFRNQQ